MANTSKPEPDEIMVVNDLPGEECRIAILQDDHLEELYTERAATATNVGNIYKGRVINVESAIQAAFVDYGQGQAGFLHISDLHPRYFPGSKRTERVGRKIPRRSRPPMQEALRRGDEVLVQVLKEGVGTKGPTLTSYLSIPGRLLVMMPDMDRVGVSRKVDDPQRRREMRDILDALDLPENFGFILRTAGFGRSKTDLQRDVAYLTRLWKVMDKRIESVGAPCELYVESDLFVRTIRDILRPTIKAIVVDSESAHRRGQALLRVVAPRSAPSLIRYRAQVPIFHAFDVERQIELIHSREVPLPSGGKLVIEQTEALVAIDVNSGRSRSASDSETNAFRTNIEAVDEICRQLRLRDLGGLVINDLIDMYDGGHRRQIEDRFRSGLARDRAKSTLLRLSEFGVAELTRQRMRPSLRKSHFMPCPNCNGRGEIKNPESVGADASRQAGYLLQFARVQRIEIACSPHVASVLLSGKRRELVRLEDTTGKRIDVRVSETIATDRVDYYAYDERNADIDVSKLPPPKPPTIAQLEQADRKAAAEPEQEPDMAPRPEAPDEAEAASAGSRKRRRRRSPAPARADEMLELEAEELALADARAEADDRDGKSKSEDTAEGEEKPPGRRRRRRRRGRGGRAPVEDAQPIRIHQLASELGVPSRDVLDSAKSEDGVEVTTHMSSVTNPVADVIRRLFRRKPAASAQTAKKGQTTKPAKIDKPVTSGKPIDETVTAEAVTDKAVTAEVTTGEAAAQQDESKPSSTSRRRGGRRRRGRRGSGGGAKAAAAAGVQDKPETADQRVADDSGERSSRSSKKRRRRRGGGSGTATAGTALTGTAAAGGDSDASSNGKDRASGKPGRAATEPTTPARLPREPEQRRQPKEPREHREPQEPRKPKEQRAPAPAAIGAGAGDAESKPAPARRRGALYRTRRPLAQGARGGKGPNAE